MKRALCLCIAAALAAPVPALAAIDCSRARTNSEKLLCSNSRLAAADQRMAFAFREAINRGIKPEVLMESQRTWIRDARAQQAVGSVLAAEQAARRQRRIGEITVFIEGARKQIDQIAGAIQVFEVDHAHRSRTDNQDRLAGVPVQYQIDHGLPI